MSRSGVWFDEDSLTRMGITMDEAREAIRRADEEWYGVAHPGFRHVRVDVVGLVPARWRVEEFDAHGHLKWYDQGWGLYPRSAMRKAWARIREWEKTA